MNQLAAAEQPPRTPELRDPFALPYDYSLLSPQEISQLFGQSFADALSDLTPTEWQGPVVSSYGLHLIQVSERVEGQLLERSLVHEQVLQDLLREQREEAKAQAYKALRDQPAAEGQFLISKVTNRRNSRGGQGGQQEWNAHCQ